MLAGKLLFSKLWPQVAANYDHDALLKSPALDADLKKLTALIETFSAEAGESEDVTKKRLAKLVEEFCHSKKLRGPDCSESIDCVLGSVRLRDSLELDLLRANDTLNMDTDAVNRLLELLIDETKDWGMRQGELRSQRHVLLRKYQFWSTYSIDDSSQPFAGDITDEKLPCAFGLGNDDLAGEFQPGNYVKLAYEIPDGKPPKKPTAFDAGCYSYWRPGGVTQPLNSCRDLTGLREVVHEPISVNDLVYPPTEFEA